MKRELLIDGDVINYLFAHRCQRVGSFPHGRHGRPVWHMYAREEEGMFEVRKFIRELHERLEADSCRVALSDLDGNFRKGVLAEYKANRIGAQRPLLFYRLREFLVEEYAAEWWKDLEGDDLLGIWATEPRDDDAETVICTIDKDLRTVPGALYDWNHQDRGVEYVSHSEAVHFFLTQVLTGDKTDNYPGCPKVGPVNAERVLAAADGDGWGAVVAAYRKRGLSEAVALANARCARILQHGDYNFETQEVKLWDPR